MQEEPELEMPRRVNLFVTCLVDQLAPQVGESTVNVLESLGLKVDFLFDQTCCGQPAFNSGFRRDAREVARRFVEMFDATEGPIVCPSGSCVAMVRNFYPILFRAEPQTLKMVQRVKSRVYEFSEFIVDVMGKKDLGASWNTDATYHRCCHLQRELYVDQQPTKLLAEVDGLELIPMERDEVCCGFGGAFAVKMPTISTAMMDEKLDHIAATGASKVIAGDTGCILHMQGGLRRRGSEVQVLHIAEVLDNMRAKQIDGAS